MPLGGLWEFRTGDDLKWASPDYDDSAWERLRVDRGYGQQAHKGYTGFDWYRRHIDFAAAVPGKKWL